MPDHKVFDRIFDAKVKHHLWQPTFVTDYPIEISPLAKKHRSKPGLVERFELYVAGNELANAYSELNDPVDQRQRMEKQLALKKTDEEVEMMDESFLDRARTRHAASGGIGYRRRSPDDAAARANLYPRSDSSFLCSNPEI